MRIIKEPVGICALMFLLQHCFDIILLLTSHTCHSKHPLPTRENSTHGHHQLVNTKIRLCSLQPKMEKLYTVTKNKTGSCGSDHELLIAKFRLKLKKVWKITRPFTYDLNQIPYDYTVEVMNRFKGLDLVNRVPEERQMEVCNTVQETGIKPSPWKRNAKKQNGCLGRTYK